jgi:hypothetical protein
MTKKLLSLVLFFILMNISLFAGSKNYSADINQKSSSLLDTTKPVIVHTPISNIPKVIWPVSVNAVVTDSSGIDSVWVKWYKNTPATMNRRFRLNNISGNNYSAIFNSVIADVNYYDSIFYRIFAQDNSGNHNIDSTALYKFKILLIMQGCAGNDILPSNYPYTTYWMDGRTQILITAPELIGLGLYANMPILSIALYVQSNNSPPLNGFCVSFQNTSLTTLTGFVNSGWTIGYYGTYSIMGTGRQTITMTNYNFHWNGTGNLLIEICYDNSNYIQYSPVNSSYAPGMTWGYYTDNSSGCTLTGGSAQTNRPNICFMVPDKILPNNSNIPADYSLSQNYPNPFNPITRIDFDIPKNGFVSLKVYDILGREVQTLVNENKTAGSYSVDFNGADLTSGVYFYRLESEGFSNVKRMIVIK